MSAASAPPTDTVPGASGDGAGLRHPLWSPRRLLASPEAGVGFALVVLVAVFAVLQPERFPTWDNARNLLADSSVLVVLAMATTFVIISRGLDLSLGSVIAFAEVAAVKAMADVDGGLRACLLGLAVALLAGVAWGAVNGFFVAYASMPPFIVTLATLGIALGAANVLSGGNDIATVPTVLVDRVGVGLVAGLPVLTLIAAVVAVAAVWTLRWTRFGRHTYATGSDPVAAARAGIDVRRHTMKIYTAAGALYGLAAFLNLARFSTTTIAGHTTDALDAIAAVALGGSSLFGGVGSAAGSLIGVFVPTVLENGLIISSVPPFWQQIGVGVALLAAIYGDQVRRRAQRRQ